MAMREIDADSLAARFIRLHSHGRRPAGRPHRQRKRCIVALHQRKGAPYVLKRGGKKVLSGTAKPNRKRQVRIEVSGVDEGTYLLVVGKGDQRKRRSITVRRPIP